MYASLRNYNFEFTRVHIQSIFLQCAKQIFFPMGFVFLFKQISRKLKTG